MFLSGQEKVLIIFYVVEMHCTKKFIQIMIFLQVHEICKEIYVFGQTFQITIENEYYRNITER